MGEALIPILIGVASTAVSAGTSSYQARKSRQEARKAEKRATARQREAEEKSWERYQEASTPDPAAVEAAATQHRGQLGQARAGAYRNLASQLAGRGFGSGSGLGVQAAADIERSYLGGLGQMGTELTKFQTTPMFGPPSSIYPQALGYMQPMTGAAAAGLGAGASSLNQALGYYYAQSLDKQQTPQQGTTWSQHYQDPNQPTSSWYPY